MTTQDWRAFSVLLSRVRSTSATVCMALAPAIFGCNALVEDGQEPGEADGGQVTSLGLSEECASVVEQRTGGALAPCESDDRCDAFVQDPTHTREVWIHLKQASDYASDKPNPQLDAEREGFAKRDQCLVEWLDAQGLSNELGSDSYIIVQASYEAIKPLLSVQGVEDYSPYCGEDCGCYDRGIDHCEEDPFCSVNNFREVQLDQACFAVTDYCSDWDGVLTTGLSGSPGFSNRQTPDGKCVETFDFDKEFPEAPPDSACGQTPEDLPECDE